MKTPWILAVLAAALVGCNSEAPKAAETDAKAPAAEASKTPEAKGTEAATSTAPSLADLPSNLRHDAYEYYGLAWEKPIPMQVNSGTGAPVVTGTQTTTLKEIKDGKAVFAVTRTGQLESLGGNELSLEPDGIYLKSSTIAKVGTRDVEMPAQLTPGKTWKTTTELDNAGQSMKVTNTYKVEGTRPVETKVGKYPDALLITSTGTGTQNGEAVKISTRAWFVKGRGNVKAEIVRTLGTNKPETIVFQETK